MQRPSPRLCRASSRGSARRRAKFSAAKNLGPSAAQFGKDIVQPFIHPIQTVKDLGALGQGIYGLFIPGEQANEDVARAVGEYFADRYGGIDNIKRTFASDPVGFIADATVIFGFHRINKLLSYVFISRKSKEFFKII